MKIRSDFKWYFDSLASGLPGERLFIEDLNLGNMSVTNDIENVIKEIKRNVPDIRQYQIQYLDSNDEWTRIILDENGDFKEFMVKYG